jgi:hypothetical protein
MSILQSGTRDLPLTTKAPTKVEADDDDSDGMKVGKGVNVVDGLSCAVFSGTRAQPCFHTNVHLHLLFMT